MAPRHHKGEWVLALYKWQGRLCQDMSPTKPPQKIRKDCGREQGKDVRPWKRNHTIHQGCKKGDIVGIHLESLKKTRSKARLKEQGEDVTLKKKKKGRKRERTKSVEILVREESVKQGLRSLLMQHQRQRRCIDSGQPTVSLKENRVEWHRSLRNEAVERGVKDGSMGEEEEEAKRRQWDLDSANKLSIM